ncbi:amidohydrolase family protein [Pigmentiphaga soli]|uniref:Amidohydrolase family protein n=1 Tax=Pigmentiphaga soli TaxID=1007095 RepID=A0ABP8H672_9BURK
MRLTLCDSHVHVFDPGRFPYAPQRRFTPGPAGVGALRAHLARIGAARVVLVQPSVYGTDHACLLDALAQLGPTARGVGVLAPDTSPVVVDALDRAGVRGARLNLAVDGDRDIGRARRRIAGIDAIIPDRWHVQLHAAPEVLAGLADDIAACGRHFVADHFALATAAQGPDTPAWARLLPLAAAGRLTVKLSAPYLGSARPAPYLDMKPFVLRLARANPGAIVWGSNWPHTQGTGRKPDDDPGRIEPFRTENDGAWLAVCEAWLQAAGLAPDRLDRNAQALYGFGPG